MVEGLLREENLPRLPSRRVRRTSETQTMRAPETLGNETISGLNGDRDDEEATEGRRTYEGTARMDNALPANDGMHALRQKLHEIRQLALSTEEKAQRMHNLMTQDWLARRPAVEEPVALDAGQAAPPLDPKNPYNVSPTDLEPSYSPYPAVIEDAEDENGAKEAGEEEEVYMLGCVHYKRNVKVQCFDCHRWYPCRHCHDQSADLPFPHQLRRKLVKNMLCMLCQTPQPVGETCVKCEEYAAWYYCSICQFWDNDSNKRIYHCDDCGICRVGEGLGKDFVHCKKCNVCISISTSAAHPCIEGATEGNCPLCLDQLFESRTDVVSLPCGHYMHGECYKELMAVTYKCPICSKSAVNMEPQWRKLTDEIRAQPMPEDDAELEGLLPQLEAPPDEQQQRDSQVNPHFDPEPRRPRLVWVGCNDCSGRSWTPFHWLGLKCQVCDSYNTNQMAPTAFRETETERLIRQHQIHRHHDFTGDAVLRDAGIGIPDPDVFDSEDRRVDSALATAASPPPSTNANLAVPPTSPHSPPSSLPSPRRYFVQPDDETAGAGGFLPTNLRRPSFTTLPSSATFASASATLPNLPEMPRLPRFPMLLPQLPQMPQMPHSLPRLSRLGLQEALPRWGASASAGVFDSLSRGLSPMRYYLQGMDLVDWDSGGEEADERGDGYNDDVESDAGKGADTDDAKPEAGQYAWDHWPGTWGAWWGRTGEGGDTLAPPVGLRDASPSSVRSDPTAGGVLAGRRAWRRGLSGSFWERARWEWSGDWTNWRGEEGERGREGRGRSGSGGEEVESGTEEEGSEEESETEVTEDGDEDDEGGAAGGELDLDLVGHR